MDSVKKPTKEQIRLYMEQRQAERKVPPPIEEIRRRLGWSLVLTRVDWCASENALLKCECAKFTPINY